MNTQNNNLLRQVYYEENTHGKQTWFLKHITCVQ